MDILELSYQKITNKRAVKLFYECAYSMNHGDKNWSPELRIDVEGLFNSKKNSYYKMGICERFLVYDKNKVVGRYAFLIHPKKDKGYEPLLCGVGFMEHINTPKVIMFMLDHAKKWLKEKGYHDYKGIRGPISCGENDRYWGVLAKQYTSYPAVYGLPHHPSYYAKLYETTGAKLLDHHESFYIDMWKPLNRFVKQVSKRVTRYLDLKLIPITKKTIYRQLETVRYLYNECWSHQNSAVREQQFTAMTKSESVSIAKQLKAVICPHASYIIYHGATPIAFVLSVIDMNEYSRQTGGKLSFWHYPHFLKVKRNSESLRSLVYGTLPSYRNKGIEAYLLVEGQKRLNTYMPSVKRVCFGWVSAQNKTMMKNISKLGVDSLTRHDTYYWLF